MLHGRLSSCLTNDLSSSTVNSFWLWDLPPPERYLKHRLKLIYTPLSTLTGKKKEKKIKKNKENGRADKLNNSNLHKCE